jgi:hypothetical protein
MVVNAVTAPAAGLAVGVAAVTRLLPGLALPLSHPAAIKPKASTSTVTPDMSMLLRFFSVFIKRPLLTIG